MDTKSFRRLGTAVMVGLGIVLGCSTLLSRTVLAFKPTRGLAPAGSESHQSITDDVVRRLDQEFFGVAVLTRSMNKALQEIADADADVDFLHFFSADHHFDDEHFAGGQTLLVQAFQDVQDALHNKNASGARKRLGQALHTLQDFYSHSNWIELGHTGPNTSLGDPRQSITNTSPAGETTCTSCTSCTNCSTNLTTAHLSSGYFGVILSSKPAGKCSHGGSGDRTSTTAPTGGINKDAADCNTSPHDSLHHAAASAAGQSTELFIRSIKAKVSPSELKLLFGVGPTLTISIDTTGSMGDIIESVKNQAIQIVDNRLGTDQEPSKYVLAPFNDPGVPSPTVTDDPDTFKAAISALVASGGGDCPELSMAGMFNGISASDDGADLFMFTDASSKDASRAGDVENLAISKDVKIFPFVFGSCSPIDPAYVRVANNSGGQFFFLARAEAGAITTLADAVVRANAVDVLSIRDTLTGVPRTYSVPVDTTLSKVSFSTSGTTNVTIRRPDGSVVTGSDPTATFVPLTSGLIVSINNPAVGAWSVALTGNSSCSLLVSGESSLQLSSFRFVTLGGRPGHEGFFPIDGLPLAGQPGTAEAVMEGAYGSVRFDLRDPAGNILQVLHLPRITVEANEFLGDLPVPSTAFVTYAAGTDAAGSAFQRVLPAIILPASIKILAPVAQDLRPGQATVYDFQVTNLGPRDTFQVTGTDDQAFLRSVSPTSVTLNTNETATVTLVLQPPSAVRTGTSDVLTVTAQSSISGARNFAIVTSFVIINRPPDVSQARASSPILTVPDHRLVDIDIQSVTDPDGDTVTIRIDRIVQDEPTNGLGDGDTCPDGFGIGTSTASLRAERSGHGNGRVYTVFFTASDGRGGNTSGSVNVAVRHDDGHDAIDDGLNVDSTVCR